MILVLYVPALHRGYIELFEKYKDKAETLYLLGDDVIADFPLAAREIRTIKAETMRSLLQGSGFFKDVIIATKEVLTKLSQQNDLMIVLTNEQISDEIRKTYFTTHTITEESPFLRYDEKVVKAARQEIEWDGEITSDQIPQSIMQQIQTEQDKSSDWFLQVGAAIALPNGEVIALGHNQRVPTPHDSWLVGDPRNYVQYGTDTHQRTTLHAEQAVIAECARRGLTVEGSDFYVTAFPCPDCASLIAHTKPKCVYFYDGYSQLSSTEVLKHNNIKIIKVTLK